MFNYRGDKDEEYNTLDRPNSTSRSLYTSHTYASTLPSRTAGPKRGIYDYNSDMDINKSSTFDPGKISRAGSFPLVDMAGMHRMSTHSSRSGSFTSIDSKELAYANVSQDEKFDDPVYEYIKGDEEIAHNPLYDSPQKRPGGT